MKESTKDKLRWFFSATILLVVVSFVARVWSTNCGRKPDRPRPRWHLVARSQILKGSVLTEGKLQPRLARLPEDARFVPTLKEAVGKFALERVEENTVLKREMISEIVSGNIPPGGAVVPVEVATDDAVGLVPGMHLAFAQDKQMVPSAKDLAKPHPQPSFDLLAVSPSPRTPATTTLIVAVPKCRLSTAVTISTGQWRPIVLGQ
jgi:hypothetical protein